jgi:hypothetical protein
MSEVGHLAHDPGLAGGPPPVGGEPRPCCLDTTMGFTPASGLVMGTPG